MMTSHKHSFQCFDAVVEKPSLPARHNFALPHTSSFTSAHWEKLENHRCSLCSESQQAKPVTSEISGNQSASWYQPKSPIQQHTPRRPMRPEVDPVDGLAHHHHSHNQQCHTHRHRKRIVLVKNSNPSLQKTILLHRKPLHSLGVFMDDVSELMQCLIRKLYTLDGHKVDSVQNLLQGPSILVCVGREPLRPLLLDSSQKYSEDKLPKLILKSQSSTCNEDQGYKINVNFGLKSKKSIPPGPFPKVRENMLDDDIEKRVLVNKDGSLSMEMKVRFRLLNDKTLHCSTEIKKSSCTFNVSFLGQDNVYYPQCGHGESCSETDALSASEADDVYITKLYQKHLEAPHCQLCCTQCQEYDIWKNPACSEQETLRHIGSTSSSAPSHKIKCKMGSVDSVRTTSCEEYTENVVEKATCIQRTVGEGDKGDTTVQYCTISRCSSRSEVYSVSAKAKKEGYTDEKYGKNEYIHGFVEQEKRHVPSKDLKQYQMSVPITQVSTEDERPLSVETNSSDILTSLKEDEDNEETDLSPSNSRASQNNKENDEQTKNVVVSSYSFTPCKPQGSPKQSLSPSTSSTASCCSVKSKTLKKFVVTETQENVDQDKNITPSSTPHRSQHKESTHDTAGEKLEEINQSEDVLDETDVLYTETDMRALKSVSDLSKTCDDTSVDAIDTSQTNEKGRSSAMSTLPNPHADLTISNTCVVAEQEFWNLKDPIVGYAKNKTEESVDVTHEENVANAMSPKLNVSARSSRSRLSEVACKERKTPELQNREHAQSVMPVHSNASTISKQSTVSELLHNKTEDLTEVVMPHALSNISRSAKISAGTPVDMDNRLLMERVPTASPHDSNVVEEATEDHDPSAKSNKSNTLSRSNALKISLVAHEEADVVEEKKLKRPSSVMISKSEFSVKSKTSYILDISPHDSSVVKATEDRASSAKSNKSNTSSRSNASKISLVASEEADVVEEKNLKRPSSVRSSKSAASLRSTKSKLIDKRDYITAEKTEQLQDRYTTRVVPSKPSDSELSKKTKTFEATLEKSGNFEDNSKEQAPSTMSTKSNTPTKSNKSEMLEMGMGDKEERPLSATSSKSKKSKRSVVSDAPCEHEEEETKQIGRKSQIALSERSQISRESKALEASRTNTGNEDNREQAQSAISCTSILSDRSNLAPDRVDNTGSIKDLLKETESAYEETKDDRAASAMSSKSKMSSLSNKSKDLTHERAPVSMSEKSKVSIKPKNSKMDQSKDEGEEKHERTSVSASPNSNMSARSKKYESLAVVSPAEMENQHTERTLSTMSGNSNTSKTSKKKKEELVERSSSALSAKYNTSVRSKESATQSNRPMVKIHLGTISPKSSTAAKDEKFDFSIIPNHSPMVDVKSEETWDMSDMSPKSSVSSYGVSLNEKSDSALSGLKISMTEYLNNANNEERASSALSIKSNTSSVHHTSERVLSPASTSVSTGIVEEYDVDHAEEENSVPLASVNSTPQFQSKTDVYCKDSSKTIGKKNQQSTQTPDNRAKSSLTAETIVSDKSKKSECTHKNYSQPITDNDMPNNKYAKKNPKKSSSRRSAHSNFDSSKTKDRNSSAVTDRPKSNMSNTLLHLEVNGQSTKANVTCNSVGERSKSNLSSEEEDISRLHSTAMFITSVSADNKPVIYTDFSNRRSSPSNENANKLNTTRDLIVCGRTSNGSLVATNCSRDGNENKSEKNINSSCKHSRGSMTQKVDNNYSELVPSILPSSSPTEVVNEWLKKIPLDSELYDEFHENFEEEEQLKMSGKVTQYERGKGSDGDTDAAVLRPQNEQLGVEESENNESKVGDVKETAKDLAVIENIQPCTFPDIPSSVQLMRILLSPKLDRCNSLPEASPVYGRKLSMSARGFLDSLVNLQLLDLDPNDVNGKAEKYNDLMDTLQSLWLCDTSDRVAITQKNKVNNQQFKDEEFNVKPSSGVDITSNSQDSGTSSVNESTVTQKSRTNTEGEDIEILTNVHEIDKTETVFNGIETKSDSATPHIASQVQWTPENEAEENLQDSNIFSAVSDITIRNDYSPREPPNTASISNKSFGNDSNANQKLTDHEEDTGSESPSLEQMAQLTEKVSQDPDPVWVLNLLNKIEKQFMTHYVTAMDEFKVRWNLNDNEQLDAMICELRDEVHKRIQASINNELRKFQGHTGRPRPPKETTSRESSILTKQKRRRLKVHLNQSIDTGSGRLMNVFGNQQNDDEYCPCDTCMKKKTSSKPAMEVLNFAPHAPMMIDFDLRKILNLERKAPSNSKENMKETDNEDASKTQPNKSEQLKNDQPMRESNNTSWALEQESPLVSGELGDHVELRNGTKILEVANEDPNAEEENVQSGLADMVTEVKITESEEEVCDELHEGQESVEYETIREEHTLETRTAKDNMAIEAGTVGEQEVTEGESTGGKGTDVQPSDAERGDETAEDKTLNKKQSMGESTSEYNEAVEGDISESEPQEKGEIPDEEKEKHEDAKTETTWKNILVKPDIAVEAESVKADAAGKEVATIVTEERKIKSEIIEDIKEAEHKSDGIMYLEDGTDEEDHTAEEGKSQSTDNEERDEKNKSAEEYVSIKKICKESGEDDLFNEEMISEPEEDGDITEHESAEEASPINNESEKGETDNDELDAEIKTTKAETAADEDLADNETNEYRENLYDDALDRTEIITAKAAEIGITNNNVTTEDGEMSVDLAADVGETSEANAAEDNDYESAEDAETSQAQTAENASDDGTAENGEIPKAKISEDGEVTDDDIANDAGADDGVTGDTEIADDKDTDDDEISEIEEMFCNETLDNGVKAKAKNMKPPNMKKATEYTETHDDGTSEDGDSAGAVVADDEETDEATEESENNNDDESTNESKTERAEQTVDSEIIESGEAHTKALKQFVGDKMSIDNVQKTEGEQKNYENANDETAEDTVMDRSQSEEDGETADDEADIGEIADDGRTEDGETPNDNTADDGTAEEYDMEEVDETTEAETAEDGEKYDDGRTDREIGDEVFDDKAITGTETEENEETAETKTGEDIETADNGTIEDGDTDDERKAEDEELSENKIAQNGEIAKGRIEVYDKTDDSETLENGETAGEVNGETLEKNSDEAVINSHNIKTKQISEMMSINQDADILESNRYNVNSVNNRESDEGGDEAEDETERIVETDERAFYQGLKIPAMQSTKWSLHKDVHADERTIASFDCAVKMYPASEDGEDADGEDSETEVHNNGGSVENDEDG